MAFTYTEGSIADRDRLRLLIQDTRLGEAQFQDAELDDLLSQESDNVTGAGALALETLANRYARQFSFTADGHSFSKIEVVRELRTQARALRARARGTTVVMPQRVDGYSSTVASDEVVSWPAGVE